jgi:hypothetical protein
MPRAQDTAPGSCPWKQLVHALPIAAESFCAEGDSVPALEHQPLPNAGPGIADRLASLDTEGSRGRLYGEVSKCRQSSSAS